MARFRSETKTCPYCAETVKAAAIRCRFCQADLDEPTPAPLPAEAEAEASADRAADEVPEDGAEDTPEPARGNLLGARRLTAALTVLLACVVTLLAVQVAQARDDSAAAAPSGQLVDEDARTAVVVSAADLTQRALSYSYKQFEGDLEIAEAGMAPSLLEQYRSTMAQVRDNVMKNKITLQATAVSSAIITATERRAEVLVFVNQVTSAEATKNQQQDQNRLVVNLVRSEGDWVLSEINALG